MLRCILAVVATFIAVNVLVMALFLATTVALGLEGALRPGEYWTRSTFNAVVFSGSLLIALVAGLLCGRMARSMSAAYIVAALMLGLGLFRASQNAARPDPPARPQPAAGQSQADYLNQVMTQMQTVGKEPNWFAFSVPVVGAAALLIGSFLAVRRRAPAPLPQPA